MCLHPINIKSETGETNTVPCGKCAECKQRRINEWSIRLYEELKVSSSAWFITLTYSDRFVPIGDDGHLTLCKRDVQLFMKRLRRNNPKYKIRYYLVGEYGELGTERPHYHLILFNCSNDETEMYTIIADSWKQGNKQIGRIHIGTVTPASIHYTLKYSLKSDEKYEYKESPFALMSRRPGLGSNYLRTHGEYHKKNSQNFHYTLDGGVKRNLPRYYRDKIYNKHVRSVHAAKSRIKNKKRLEERKRAHEKKSEKDFWRYEIEQIESFEKRVFEQKQQKRKL